MGTPRDRPLLERLVRSLFPPGSFPEIVYSRAADEVAHDSWVCQVLHREAADTAPDPFARLAESADGPALLEVVPDAAGRVAAGSFARPA